MTPHKVGQPVERVQSQMSKHNWMEPKVQFELGHKKEKRKKDWLSLQPPDYRLTVGMNTKVCPFFF